MFPTATGKARREMRTAMSKLFIVSGPSGAGKGTLVNEAVRKFDDIFLSISMTTRQPRPGEAEGVNYYYVSEDEFKQRIAENKMLEYAVYCGTYYGTPLEPVKKALDEGKSLILEIETQGMKQVKAKMPDAVTIFIAPPSMDELERRILKRNPDEKPEAVQKRMEKAKAEMLMLDEYDYVVVNDELEKAENDFFKIISMELIKK